MCIAMVAACGFPAPRGSQALIAELAEDLARLGHQVHVVTYPEGMAYCAPERVILHPRRRVPAARCNLGWRRLARDVRLGIELYRVVRREAVDVIHAHNYEAPVCAYVVRRLTGVPVVYHTHNALADELETYFQGRLARALARWLGRALDRQVPRRADFVIALTPELARFLESCGVRPDRIQVAVPGIAVHESPFSQIVAGPESASFTVGYAGNLDAYQDLDVLFRGFAHFRRQVQNARLLVITHEQDWRRRAGWRLEELVARGLARVVVAPTAAAVREHLRCADVLVCARSSWSGYPMKLLNYRAAGRPVVVAAASAKGIEDGANGLIFRDRDAWHLARQLERLHGNAALRQRLAANAHAGLLQNHDREKIASEIVKIHARLSSCRVEGRSPERGRRAVREGAQGAGS